MPMDSSFVQLVLGLKNMSMQKRQLDLDDKKFTEQQNQFKKMVEQFEHTHEDADVTRALEQVGKMMPDQQAAWRTLMESTTFKRNPDALNALMSIAGSSPVSQGMALMNPQQRSGLNQDAAALAATGGQMGMGGSMTSQLQGALAGGGQVPQGLAQAGVDQNAFNALVQNRAAQAAQGYTGEQMGVQQFNAVTGRGGVELGFAELNERHNQFMASYKLDALKGAGQGKPLSSSDAVALMRGAGDLLNDMKNPKSAKADNVARQQLFNQTIQTLRQAGYLGTGMFNVPGAAQQQLNQPVGNPNSPFTNLLQGFTGAPSPYSFNPAPYGSQPPIRR